MGAVPAFPWPGGAKAAVSLSFDDARPSQLDHGLPLFAAHGLAATFYVSLPTLKARADEWRAAAARGHELGHHSVTHPCSGNFTWARTNALESYTLARFEAEELVPADETIRLATGVTPRTFAYPCGQTFVGREAGLTSYIPLIGRRFLAGRGFRSEYVNAPDYCDLANLGGVDGDELTLDEYRGWTERALAEGGWLVFAGHDIEPREGRQVSSVAQLDRYLGWLAANRSSVWTATVAEIAAYVKERKRTS